MSIYIKVCVFMHILQSLFRNMKVNFFTESSIKDVCFNIQVLLLNVQCPDLVQNYEMKLNDIL